MAAGKMFPIQTQKGAEPHPLRIPWELAELAYSVYASRYGRSQSLERLAERGGFGPNEMDMFVPGWRDKCSRITKIEKALEESVKLQSHYAHLLNIWDGGQRMQFANSDAWIRRLEDIESASQPEQPTTP
jgi:hypothetical protein